MVLNITTIFILVSQDDFQ